MKIRLRNSDQRTEHALQSILASERSIATLTVEGYCAAETSNLPVSRFNVGKEMDNNKGNSGSLGIEMLSKAIEGIESIKVTLESMERRMYNFEVGFEAVVTAAARPRHLETYTGRTNDIELPSIHSEEAGDNGGIIAPRHMPRSQLENTLTETTFHKSTVPSSPKTRMIEMMEEEREEQERALEQIEDPSEETRPCRTCAQPISIACFRRDHFTWCTTHELMTDEDGVCLQSPSDDAAKEVARCRIIQCDMTEEEAYWVEVKENALIGGAGFREPGEPYVH